MGFKALVLRPFLRLEICLKRYGMHLLDIVIPAKVGIQKLL